MHTAHYNKNEKSDQLLQELLCPQQFIFLQSGTKKEVLKELITCLSLLPEVRSAQELTEKIYEREALMSTGIGLGIAVPHVRIESVDNLVMAGGISTSGIVDYESLDGAPVKLIFMIAARPDQHTEYIRLLSQISSRLKDDELRQKLYHCDSSEKACRILLNTAKVQCT